MKLAVAVALATIAVPSFAQQSQQVDGHFRQDGSYVQPHYRTAPDNRLHNNWSSEGNVNPYTGQRGTRPHEFSSPPALRQPPSYVMPEQPRWDGQQRQQPRSRF